MAERITIASIFNKVDVTSRRSVTSPSWNSVDESRWRQRRGQLQLAELEDHFKRYYAPEIARQLDRGLITGREARWLTDSHCYNVYRGKPEQI